MTPVILPPPPSRTVCDRPGCGGRLVLARLKPSAPLVIACRKCGKPTEAALRRLAANP